MSEERMMETTRRRGKQLSPTLTHLSIRLPTEVVDYFKNAGQFGNYTGAIRNVLTQYVKEKKMNDNDVPCRVTADLKRYMNKEDGYETVMEEQVRIADEYNDEDLEFPT